MDGVWATAPYLHNGSVPNLASLPPGCRTVFVLHDVEGCEHREIGELLGISDGTSKSQLHKARMRLRAALASAAGAVGARKS